MLTSFFSSVSLAKLLKTSFIFFVVIAFTAVIFGSFTSRAQAQTCGTERKCYSCGSDPSKWQAGCAPTGQKCVDVPKSCPTAPTAPAPTTSTPTQQAPTAPTTTSTSTCKAEVYNECCGPGTSRRVERKCPSGSYVVGACNQTDAACGTQPTTPVSCPPGQFWNEATKNCRAADSNQDLPNGATPKPGVDPGTGGTTPGTGGTSPAKPGDGNIANPACNPNQVCGYCGGNLLGEDLGPAGPGVPVSLPDTANNVTYCVNSPNQTFAQYVLACDCTGDGKTDRQIITGSVTGNQAAAYCASTVCPAVGSTLPSGQQKVCEPGYPYQCVGDGKGIMCNAQGTGPIAAGTVVNAHACVTTEQQDFGPPSGAGDNNCEQISFAGCSGLKNCWNCMKYDSPTGKYKTTGTYCVLEPGLSCGAKLPPSTPLPGAPTPPPAPTPPITTQGPVCLSLAVSKQVPRKGDTVTFTCGRVNGAARYEFRVRKPDGTFQTLAAATTPTNQSQPFTIESNGAHAAQCRICTGAAASTCHAWENL